MQDVWYADDRDMVKWGVLVRLSDIFEAARILQVAFWRPSTFGHLLIDGQEHNLPREVIAHFRNVRMIGSLHTRARVTVFDPVFQDRDVYQQAVLGLLRTFHEERCIVFLDPDIGLERQNHPTLDHVLETEARAVWDAMKKGDVFAFYQHKTNRGARPWIEPKKLQLARALGIAPDNIKEALAPEIAGDVVVFYTQKT